MTNENQTRHNQKNIEPKNLLGTDQMKSIPSLNLKTLSDEELDQSFVGVAHKERQTLSEVLLHIEEVHRRKLYLKKSFGSLFEYLTKRLKYSAGSAQRRIDAYRLSKEVPEVTENLESGDLNLAQVSLVQKSFRAMKKKDPSNPLKPSHRSLNQIKQDRANEIQQKSQIVNELKQKSNSESQVIVAKALNLEVKTEMKLKHQADESVRLEITLTKEQWAKLNHMRDLLSHSLPHGSWDQILEYVSDKVIASKMETRKAQPKSENSLFTLRKMVIKRDQCCQYQDPKSQKICTSTWQLQVDHIKPRWAGGKDELTNLRALCGKHNRQIYRWQSGIRSSGWQRGIHPSCL